jgi:hypothetical protein
MFTENRKWRISNSVYLPGFELSSKVLNCRTFPSLLLGVHFPRHCFPPPRAAVHVFLVKCVYSHMKWDSHDGLACFVICGYGSVNSVLSAFLTFPCIFTYFWQLSATCDLSCITRICRYSLAMNIHFTNSWSNFRFFFNIHSTLFHLFCYT